MIMTNKYLWILIAVAALVVGLILGYSYGLQRGEKAGFEKSKSEITKLQEEIKNRALEQAVKAANPFALPTLPTVANPLTEAEQILEGEE